MFSSFEYYFENHITPTLFYVDNLIDLGKPKINF